MSKVQLQGNVSGTGVFTIASPNSNTDRTLTLPNETGTILTSGGAIAGTTGTFSGIIQANGGGIQFPATQVVSANANTLDDYEEGTFTPNLTFGGGSTGIVYSDRRAQYVKIGQNVFVNVYFRITSRGTSTGNADLGGFPFGTATGIDFFAPLAPRGVFNSGGEPTSLYGSGVGGQTSFEFYSCNLTGGANNRLNQNNFLSGTEMNFNFWYKTDA
jgi:hypothetical protein